MKATNLFLSLLLVLPSLSFAQSNDKAQRDAVVGAVTGVAAYKLIRRETIYKKAEGSFLTSDVRKKIVDKIEPGDKIIIRQYDREAYFDFGKSSSHKLKAVSKEMADETIKAIDIQSNIKVTSVKRVNKTITIDLIKKAGWLELGLAATSIFFSGKALLEWNPKALENSKGRLEGPRDIVVKPTRTVAGAKSTKTSATNQ